MTTIATALRIGASGHPLEVIGLLLVLYVLVKFAVRGVRR